MFGNNKTKTNGAADKAADQKAPEAQPGMPLFFTKPAPLDAQLHVKAGVKMDLPLDFARQSNSVPLAVSEFNQAAKYYPIVFTAGESIVPLAIVGLEKENIYIGKDGAWQQDVYIPAYVRKYPFVFLEVPEQEKLVLCVDEGSPHYTAEAKGDKAKKLFEDGKPSDYVKEALSFCTAYHEDQLFTRMFCDKINALGLFTPNQSNVELPSGRQIRLGGFQMIDQQKFNALPDDKILELHKEGFLPLIHFTFLATSNWQNVVNLTARAEKKSVK